MKFCLKILLAAGFWLLAAGVFFPQAIFAKGEIQSSQTVSYEVHQDGTTHVRHNISLTNLTTNYYASEYAISLGFTDLTNVAAFDSSGPLTIDVAPKDNKTDIHVAFNRQVVGKGNVLSFTITFDTSEIASKNGRIWEINVPRIKESDDLGNYSAALSVPSSFGKATYVKPKNITGMSFSKEQILGGISIVFGEFQLFDYTLTYHLTNDRLYPIITEIALPPTTGYQEVLLDKLDPHPVTVAVDKDGNWLARYRLEASQKMDIKARGKIKVLYKPQVTPWVDKGDVNEYLKPQKYWETLDPAIEQKAKELKTPKAIYDFVVQELTYDYGRIDSNLPRAGAAGVLHAPTSAICIEFTDLFIALARSAGIPAREIDGFAYTRNSKLRPLSLVKDILHAWPEYFDKEAGIWIPVDPTWGNTSGIDYFEGLDLSHIAFVIKGESSEYPSPAGSYKEQSDLEKQDVVITLSNDDTFPPKKNLSVSTDIADNTIVAGFSTSANVLVANEGNTLFYSKDGFFETDNLFPKKGNLQLDRAIPPFGNAVVDFTLKSPGYFDNFQSNLKVQLAGESFSYSVRVSPLFLVYLPWIGGGVGVAIVFFVAHYAWDLHIQRQIGADSLRGKGDKSAKPGFKLPW